MATPTQHSQVHALNAAVETVAVIPAELSENIIRGSAKLFVNGVETPTAFAFDLVDQKIMVTNLSGQLWQAGTNLEVTWEGTAVHAQVDDHEARIAALETTALKRR